MLNEPMDMWVQNTGKWCGWVNMGDTSKKVTRKVRADEATRQPAQVMAKEACTAMVHCKVRRHRFWLLCVRLQAHFLSSDLLKS